MGSATPWLTSNTFYFLQQPHPIKPLLNCCALNVTITATNITLGYFGFYESETTAFYTVGYTFNFDLVIPVIEFEDYWVGLSTINARVLLEIMEEPLINHALRLGGMLSGLPFIDILVRFVVLPHVPLVARNTERLGPTTLFLLKGAERLNHPAYPSA